MEFEDFWIAKFEEGWGGFEDIISLIEHKPIQLRTDTETQIFKGVIVIRNIHRDFEDLVELNEYTFFGLNK
jgi:hypothetical protein